MHVKLIMRLGRNIPHLKAMGDTPALLYVSPLLDTAVKMKYRLWQTLVYHVPLIRYQFSMQLTSNRHKILQFHRTQPTNHTQWTV